MARTLRVVLNVSAFDDVVGFYRDVLGLRVVGGWDRGPDDRGALLHVAEGGVVEVVGHGAGFVTPRYTDLAVAIELDDREEVDAMHQRLSRTAAAVSAPVEQTWGHYSVAVRDPVEVEIVLYADLADR